VADKVMRGTLMPVLLYRPPARPVQPASQDAAQGSAEASAAETSAAEKSAAGKSEEELCSPM
jgi:hypothetical protein